MSGARLGSVEPAEDCVIDDVDGTRVHGEVLNDRVFYADRGAVLLSGADGHGVVRQDHGHAEPIALARLGRLHVRELHPVPARRSKR
jgi:hypothetical protein